MIFLVLGVIIIPPPSFKESFLNRLAKHGRNWFFHRAIAVVDDNKRKLTEVAITYFKVIK